MRPGRLTEDERAIEGLPIRLVIALVVGVASLGIMMNVLGGIVPPGVNELDTQPQPEVISEGGGSVTVTVVDSNGDPVSNATVVAESGTADLDGIKTAETGANGTASLSISPDLAPNQEEGTVVLDVKPPSNEYQDKRDNTEILVIKE
jgi:hypothetical protein